MLQQQTKQLTLLQSTATIQMSPVMHVCARVCMCVAIGNFITFVALCNQHHNQDGQLYNYYKTPFISTPMPSLILNCWQLQMCSVSL